MVSVKSICKVATVMIIVLMLSACFDSNTVHAVSETGRTDYKLMDGVTESTVYVTDSNNVNLRLHLLKVQHGANVTLKAGYKNYYGKGSTAKTRDAKAKSWGAKSWSWSKLADHVAEYESSSDKAGNVIAATSGDFLGGNGAPYGTLVMEGHHLYKAGRPYFALLKTGKYVIKKAGESAADVLEGIGGDETLLRDGKVAIKSLETHDPKIKEARQAVGITKDQGIVLLNVDGREPSSLGATLYTMAEILKAQGCVDAINLDGGGSATFMTKRSGDQKTKLRNSQADGFVRNIASSFLIIKNSKGSAGTITGPATVSMKKANTSLSNSNGKYSYKVNGKPMSGLFMVNGKNYLFNKKGVGLSKTVKLGSTKYTFKNGVLTKCSDKKSGNIQMGRCGAGSELSNLLFAYHEKDNVMNVGLNPLVRKNGKMKNYSGIGALPWCAMRRKITKVTIGKGVTTIGNYFMCNQKRDTLIDGTKNPKMKLKKVSFPSTLKSIGKSAFYETNNLGAVVFPKKVKSLGEASFYSTGSKKMTFKGKKAVKFGKRALKSTKVKKIYVRKTKSWKKAVKTKRFKKAGYKKAVKFK